MKGIQGVLPDIDGVLHVGMHPVTRAAETLRWLEQQVYRTGLVTHTTTIALATLARRLCAIVLPVSEQQMITAPIATASSFRHHSPGKRCWVLTKG